MRKSCIVILVLSFVLMTLIGCSATSEPTSTPQPTDTPQPSPTPTIALIQVTPVEVTFPSLVGSVELHGLLYGENAVGVILSHGVGMASYNRSRWQPFAEYLAARGFMVLVYDIIGYGDSRGSADGGSSLLSVEAATAFMREQGAERIILMGEFLSTPAVLETAIANEAGDIVGVATLSAARQTRDGLCAVSDEELAELTVPSLWIDASGDYYVPEVEAMFEATTGPDKELYIYDQSADIGGVGLFRLYGDDLDIRLLNFVIYTANSAQPAAAP